MFTDPVRRGERVGGVLNYYYRQAAAQARPAENRHTKGGMRRCPKPPSYAAYKRRTRGLRTAGRIPKARTSRLR